MMKKYLTLLLLIPLAIACTPKNDGVAITGLIENLDKDNFVMGGPGGSRDSVFLDEGGNFVYEDTDIDEGGLHYMIFGNDVLYLWLAPGMEMDFYADMSDLKRTMGFTGDGSDINNYQASKNIRAFNYEWFELDEEEFRYKADSLLAEQQGKLNTAQKLDPDNPYWKMEEADILFSWANNLATYPSAHPYYADIEDYNLPEGWYDYRDQLSIDNPEYIESRAFESYIGTLVREAVSERSSGILAEDSTAVIDRNLMNLEIASNLISNEEVLSHYLTSTITGALQWTDLSELDDAIEFYKSRVTNEEYLAKFNEEYDAWSKLSEGQPMHEFTGRDLDGNQVSSVDFRGKYLYVDVWATWCGPCIHEIPFLKELEADYHDRNIVFLSYSIDEDKDAWLKFVPENELGGVQIIGEDAWESQLCKDYKIKGVPTFMFFDPEGKIISVKMTRPSDQKTRDTFDSYSDL